MPPSIGCIFISSSSSDLPILNSSASFARSNSRVTSSLSSGQGQSFSPSVAASGISFAAPATNPLSEASGGAPPKSVPAGISAARASVGEPAIPAGSS